MAGEFELVFRAPRAVTSAGEAAACVAVRDGRVAAVEPLAAGLAGRRTITLAADEVLLPGLVDSHVHVDEPGRTEWEGFASATLAAAAGGITTLVDMPLNSIPPTVDVAALEAKRKAADGQLHVDVAFWGGAVPGNAGELRGLHDAGVVGFKAFLAPSGVDEFPHLDPAELERRLGMLAGFPALAAVHAEDAQVVARAPVPAGRRYAGFLASRPRGAENLAVAQVIEAARATGARAHVLHLSSSDTLPMLASARRDGVRVSAETCPHYLTFDAETIPDGATQLKCCPPIREAENRERLWQGLAEGVIDLVVSDHSPCPPELKRLEDGDFGAAWGGIASLQLSLPAVWTAGRARGHGLADLARWMAQAPAELAGLPGKGRIAVGADADLCVFAPDEPLLVDPERLRHRHRLTPYAGRRLTGMVRSTWLRGRQVTGAERHGTTLAREAAAR
ncbi:MAG: allB [Actinomycetia bacterium]|nr:allB [Actinomycetes bacterium]